MDTTNSLSATAKVYYERLMLERLLPQLPHLAYADPGRVVTIPGKQGISVEFRRFDALGRAKKLTQGVTPESNSRTMSYLTMTPEQFGDYIVYTDVLDLVGIDPYIVDSVQAFTEQAARELDIDAREKLNAGTQVRFAGDVLGRSAIASSNKLVTSEIDKTVRTLERNNVPKIPDEFGGSYVAFVHPDAKFDLRSDSRWQDVDKYGMGVKTYSGELGRWNGVRFVVSSNCQIFVGAGLGGIDVYSTLVFGAHWYGAAMWEKNTGGVLTPTYNNQVVEIFVKALGSGGTGDPLNQRGTIGWKSNQAVMILNQLCGMRIEHAATAA